MTQHVGYVVSLRGENVWNMKCRALNIQDKEIADKFAKSASKQRQHSGL